MKDAPTQMQNAMVKRFLYASVKMAIMIIVQILALKFAPPFQVNYLKVAFCFA